jgi:hypothetical protein
MMGQRQVNLTRLPLLQLLIRHRRKACAYRCMRSLKVHNEVFDPCSFG